MLISNSVNPRNIIISLVLIPEKHIKINFSPIYVMHITKLPSYCETVSFIVICKQLSKDA